MEVVPNDWFQAFFQNIFALLSSNYSLPRTSFNFLSLMLILQPRSAWISGNVTVSPTVCVTGFNTFVPYILGCNTFKNVVLVLVLISEYYWVIVHTCPTLILPSLFKTLRLATEVNMSSSRNQEAWRPNSQVHHSSLHSVTKATTWS